MAALAAAALAAAALGGITRFLKPQHLELDGFNLFTPKKPTFPVLRCTIKEEEIACLKDSLALASDGETFVLLTGDPQGFSRRDFLIHQVLGMVEPSLLISNVCKIYNLGLETQCFEDSYASLKEMHKYDVLGWKKELSIDWKWYEDCAVKNQKVFFTMGRYVWGMSTFYVARQPLYMQPSEHAHEKWNSFSHLLFVDDNSSNLELLQQAENPIALKLTEATNIDHFISICKFLNPKQEEGKIMIIIKLSPVLMKDLRGHIEKVCKEGIAATWILDPVVTVQKGDEKMTWALKSSLDEIRYIKESLSRSGNRLGGLYLETTGAEVEECRMYEPTTMKHQARLDVGLSLSVMQELGFMKLTIFPNGGDKADTKSHFERLAFQLGIQGIVIGSWFRFCPRLTRLDRNSSQCDSLLIGDNAAANTYPYI
ncbi:hypothetical protein PTKIN_Ptkin15bG0135400 [Pterospermum kingtungense]